MVGITTLLTCETVEAQEFIIHAQIQQQPPGEVRQLYSQELSLSVSIFLIIASICAAAVLVIIIIRRKVGRRIIDVAELGVVKHI